MSTCAAASGCARKDRVWLAKERNSRRQMIRAKMPNMGCWKSKISTCKRRERVRHRVRRKGGELCVQQELELQGCSHHKNSKRKNFSMQTGQVVNRMPLRLAAWALLTACTLNSVVSVPCFVATPAASLKDIGRRTTGAGTGGESHQTHQPRISKLVRFAVSKQHHSSRTACLKQLRGSFLSSPKEALWTASPGSSLHTKRSPGSSFQSTALSLGSSLHMMRSSESYFHCAERAPGYSVQITRSLRSSTHCVTKSLSESTLAKTLRRSRILCASMSSHGSMSDTFEAWENAAMSRVSSHFLEAVHPAFNQGRTPAEAISDFVDAVRATFSQGMSLSTCVQHLIAMDEAGYAFGRK